MYRGFNLSVDPLLLSKAKHEKLYEVGQNLFAAQRRQVRRALRELVLTDGSLDGAALQAEWFPLVEADVFISHSHANTETATVLAGLLYNRFDITCFTDTTVWGYGAALLQELDDAHCTTGPGSYSYTARNVSTSHVYLMLAGALAKMIDKTECVFFLNSPDSVTPALVMDATLSPWLYFEVLTSQLVRKTLPELHVRRQQVIEKAFSDTGGQIITESFQMTHPLPLGHLTPLVFDNRFYGRWLKHSQHAAFKLDTLYDLCPELPNAT